MRVDSNNRNTKNNISFPDFSASPMQYLQYEFAHNLNHTVATFQKYMLQHSSTISTEFYRLNPAEHIKGITC